MRRAFDFGLAIAAAVALTFLLLPLLALFLRVSPGTLASALGSKPARDALVVSLVTSAIAHTFILALGTPVAYLLATKRFRGREALVSAIDLPLVLPPAVAGIALLAAFGRRGLLGGSFSALGISADLMKNVVSQETDVNGIVTKVALGEADAGFVYATDVKPAAGKVLIVENSGVVEPTVKYEIAVVRDAKHRAAAQRFVALVTSPPGQVALEKAGFGLP